LFNEAKLFVYREVWEMRKINPELQERLGKLISSMGYEYVGCEQVPQGRRFVFRIYVDRPNGVTVDDCTLVSRQVSAMMDVMDIFNGGYTLEVSSPGLDRPLFVIEHFQKYLGKRVKVRVVVPVNQRRQFKGVLREVVGDDIYLKMDETDEEVKLSFDNIEKAHLISEL
jgi:ribosome maturation factor RimP